MTALLALTAQNTVVALLLALVVYAVTRVWRNPPLAHLLWLLVLLKLVAPPLVGIDWRAMLPEVSAEQALAHVSIVGEPAQEGRLPLGSATATPAAWNYAQPLLLSLWLGGSALCAAVAVTRIVRFERRLRDTLPASERLTRLTREIAARLGIRRVPRVRYAECVEVPLLWCARDRPTIVLPRSLAGRLDERQLALVLAHELAHLRRRDHWVRGLELAVATFYWWNPLVWLVRRPIHHNEDLCCDAWVRHLYPDSTQHYAELLLNTAESLSGSSCPRLLPATPFLHSPSLKARIAMMLESRFAPRVTKSSLVLVALLALVILPSFFRTAATQARAAGKDAPPGAETNSEFPHAVKFEQGATRFENGDEITILEVRGTADTFVPGHIYLIKGTYTLASRDRAGISAYTTAKHSKDGTGSSYRPQSVRVDRGTGTFTLFLPMACEGWPHVSFYPQGTGSSFGGNYFGTGESVLKKWWGEK